MKSKKPSIEAMLFTSEEQHIDLLDNGFLTA